MDAVVPGGAGGVEVPTTTEGRTAARGDPTLPPSAPVGDNAAPPADVTEVERAPRALRQPSTAEIMALYPQAAREEQLEADVRVDLLVSERGTVVDVRIRSGGGNGFGEAAGRVARLLAFEPAIRGGGPVAVWIPWTIKFRLDG
jgi:protein TonB